MPPTGRPETVLAGGLWRMFADPPQLESAILNLEDSAEALPLSQNRPLEGTASEVILVVEDQDRVRQMSVQLLRDLGYTVIHASDAKHALAILETDVTFSLLFTDVVMPDMNGKQLADRIREQRPGTKVLYTTGYTRNAVIHNGMLDRDVAFLPKPFTIQQLATKIRQVLDQK